MKLILTFVLVIVCSGCSILRSPSSNVDSLLNNDYIEKLSRGYFEKDSENSTGIEKFRKQYAELLIKGDNDTAKILRKDVAYDLLSISDSLYQKFKEDLFSGKASLDSVFGITNLLLTGSAAAITGNIDSKTSLAAAATFLSGTKNVIDQNFFAAQTISTLIVSMDGERARVRANLVKNLKFATATEFTLSQAISEIQKYHEAGSVINAIIKINESSGETARENTKELERVEGL